MSLFNCHNPETNASIEAVGWSAIQDTCAIYLPLGLGLLAFFETQRRKRAVFSKRTTALPHRTPPPVGTGCLRWLSVLSMRDKELVQCVGLDGFVCLSYLRMCLRLCLFFSFWGVVLLVPVYLTGEQVTSTNRFFIFTMDNLAQGSPRLWAAVFTAWLFTGYTFYQVNAEWKLYVRLRERYLEFGDQDAAGGRGQVAYSVRVESIPPALRSNEALFDYFQRLFPGQVHSAVVHVESRALEGLLATRLRVLEALEEALLERKAGHLGAGSAGSRSPGLDCGKCRTWCCNGTSIEELEQDLEELNNQVEDVIRGAKQVQEAHNAACTWLRRISMARRRDPLDEDSASEAEAASGAGTSGVVSHLLETGTLVAEEVKYHVIDDVSALAEVGARGVKTVRRGIQILTVGDHAKTSSGHVTFRSLQAAADATQVLLTPGKFSLQVQQAEDPRDVIWENATVTTAGLRTRRTLTSAVVSLFAIAGWVPFLAFCQALARLDSLVKLVPSLATASQNPLVYDLLQNQLPVLIQIGILSCLPIFFLFLARRYERVKAQSTAELSVLSRYHIFQLVNIYFTIFSSSVFQAMWHVAAHPGCAFEILGRSVTTVAGYFVQMILIKALFSLPYELSRVLPTARLCLFRRLKRKELRTKRAARRVKSANNQFSPGATYPDFLLVIVICFTYASIAPVVALCGVLFFSLAYCIFKHQFVYVYVPSYETGGSLFPVFFRYTLVGLGFANVTLLGYMGMKEGWRQFACLVPLVPLVEAFRVYCREAYMDAAQSLSREATVTMGATTPARDRDFDPDLFLQPCLKAQRIVPDAQELDVRVPESSPTWRSEMGQPVAHMPSSAVGEMTALLAGEGSGMERHEVEMRKLRTGPTAGAGGRQAP